MKENKHGFKPKKEEVYTAEEPRSAADIMTTEIALRPSYWASVSGGKDSLYMLNFILHNLDRYPLDGVVHFELEIDYPFIHDVIDYMESECKRFGIRFVRIKPRKTWEELYYSFSKTGRMRGFPMRKARWCNSDYKLDAKRQLSEWLNSLGYYIIDYIGYCADEERRFNKRLTAQKAERYPLAENGITEDRIWEWAKTQPIFNHYGDRIYRVVDDCTFPGDCGTKRMCKGCEYRNLFIEQTRFRLYLLTDDGKLRRGYYRTREEAEKALED